MRSDSAYLTDMLLSAQKIGRFVAGMDEVAFRASELHQSAVVRELQIIGEAARQVTPETRQQHPTIDWVAIAGMRNRIIHEYFRVSLRIVWQVVSEEIPILIAELEAILPDSDD